MRGFEAVGAGWGFWEFGWSRLCIDLGDWLFRWAIVFGLFYLGVY